VKGCVTVADTKESGLVTDESTKETGFVTVVVLMVPALHVNACMGE